MLLADCSNASSFQTFDLVSIGALQWAKQCDVTGLELVGGVRRDAAQDDIVFETKLQDFEGFMRTEARRKLVPGVSGQLAPWFRGQICA